MRNEGGYPEADREAIVTVRVTAVAGVCVSSLWIMSRSGGRCKDMTMMAMCREVSVPLPCCTIGEWTL